MTYEVRLILPSSGSSGSGTTTGSGAGGEAEPCASSRSIFGAVIGGADTDTNKLQIHIKKTLLKHCVEGL